MFSLLLERHVARILLGSLLGRLPSGMANLAIPLALRQAGLDYAFIGIAYGAFILSSSFGGPLLGRAVDHVGQAKVLIPAALANGAGFGALAFAPGDRVVVLAGAVLAGAATPPLEPCVRTLWPNLVPADRLASAYSLDTASQDLIFIAGPLVVAVIAAAASARAALGATVVFCLAGTLLVATAPPVRAWSSAPRVPDWLGPLRSRGLLSLLGGFVGVGVALGALNVLLVDYAENHRVAGGTAALMALVSCGSLAGALAYSAVDWKGSPMPRLIAFRVGLGIPYAALCLVPSPAMMMVLMPVSGFFLAPALAVTIGMVTGLTPAGMVTEAFAWLVTLFTVGAASGSTIAGFALDHAGFGVAALTCVLGVAGGIAVLVAGRRHLVGSRSDEADACFAG